MADDPPSSSQSDGKSDSIGASPRVFILTPEMLKKLGLADKVKLIQDRVKPESPLPLVADDKKSALPRRCKKLISPKIAKNNEKNEMIVDQKHEAKKLKASVQPDPSTDSEALEKRALLHEEEKSIDERMKNARENERSSEDDKEDIEHKMMLLFGQTSAQNVDEKLENDGSDEARENPEGLFKTPKSKEMRESMERVKAAGNSTDVPTESSGIKTVEKIRCRLKPKVQWRSRKIPAKSDNDNDSRKTTEITSKSLIQADEKVATIEMTTENDGGDELPDSKIEDSVSGASKITDNKDKVLNEFNEQLPEHEADFQESAENVDCKKKSNSFKETLDCPSPRSSTSDEINAVCSTLPPGDEIVQENYELSLQESAEICKQSGDEELSPEGLPEISEKKKDISLEEKKKEISSDIPSQKMAGNEDPLNEKLAGNSENVKNSESVELDMRMASEEIGESSPPLEQISDTSVLSAAGNNSNDGDCANLSLSVKENCLGAPASDELDPASINNQKPHEVPEDSKNSSDKIPPEKPVSFNEIGPIVDQQESSEIAKQSVNSADNRVLLNGNSLGSSPAKRIPAENSNIEDNIPGPSEISTEPKVPVDSKTKTKKKNSSKSETSDRKAAKIPNKGQEKNESKPAAHSATASAPSRSSRRRSKPKIFEECISPSRRKSAESKQKPEITKEKDSDENPAMPLLPFENFSAISDDSESPKKLIIDESKCGSDGECNSADFQVTATEEKTQTSIESPRSPLNISKKIEKSHKLKESDDETIEKSMGSSPVTSKLPRNEKRSRSRRSNTNPPRVSKRPRRSSGRMKEIASLKPPDDSPSIPENAEPPTSISESKIPEMPHLSASHEEHLEENPVETPPDLPPECPKQNNKSHQKDLEDPEPPVPRRRRGGLRNRSPIPELPQTPENLNRSPKAGGPRGGKRRLAKQPSDSETPASPAEVPRSRSRRSTTKPDETDGAGLSESDETTQDDEEALTDLRKRVRGSRGRRRGPPRDREYVPRITKPQEPVVEQVIKPVSSLKTIKCGKCHEEMTSTAWSKHSLSKHNNMSWLEGEEEPNFDDEKLLKSLLVKTKKRKAVLLCENCGEGKRSVVGFMSHIRFCGKTAIEKQSLMWTCPVCMAVLMPASQEYHERQHREDQLPKKVRNFSGEERHKRRAAEKAVSNISKFTALVKDSEEPPAKKRKMTTIEDFIQKPQTSNTIPSVWKGAWARAIDNKERACCRQPGCAYSADDLEDICQHYRTCNFTPRVAFFCKLCKTSSPSELEIEQHVRKKHSDKFKDNDSDFEVPVSEDSDVDDNDDDDKKRKIPVKPKMMLPQAKFLDDTAAYRKLKGDLTFLPTLKWTFDFELEHFSFHLFDNLKPNTLRSLNNPEAYLPQLKTSMSMRNEKQKKEEKNEWKKWKRFESKVVNGIPTFFTGGPVWALSWLTLPSALYNENLHHFLAVSTHTTMGASYKLGKSYKFKNSIQIWRIGELSYDETRLEDPELSYIIGHETGTIWCLEWCPSGAYEHPNLQACKTTKIRRMGLLAAATSSGLVYIYSLPFPTEQPAPNDNINSRIFTTKPVMILHVNSELEASTEINWQCMNLSWSKLSNHDTLAAGFSNGYVALWNLTTESVLLRREINGTVHLDAYQHFYAHGHAVMAIDIVPIGEERYLATAGMDRSTKTWNLEDTSACVNSIKKGVAVGGVWMQHWPISITSYDDVLGLSHTQTYLADVRALSTRILPLLPTNSTTYGLAKSDWANAICQGTLAGEIIAVFPPQLLYLKEIDKLSRDRWLVSNIDLVDFEVKKKLEKKDYDYMPDSYEKCQKKFGIVFKDDLNNLRNSAWRKKNKKRGFLSSETLVHVPVERYPFTSVNRLAWNSNAWSYLWLAAGYENGLVRILNLNRMSAHSIMDEMLSKHAKKMFKRSQKFDNS